MAEGDNGGRSARGWLAGPSDLGAAEQASIVPSVPPIQAEVQARNEDSVREVWGLDFPVLQRRLFAWWNPLLEGLAGRL